MTLPGKFFGIANGYSGNSPPMPVRLLWSVGLVVYIDRNPLVFFEAEKRTQKLAVVGSYRHDMLRSQFD